MKQSKKHIWQSAALLSLGTTALLAGCGGGGGSSSGGNGNGGGPSVTSYNDVVALADGQQGALNLAVKPDNTATGTLAVAAVVAGARPRAASPRVLAALAAGVYPVTGTVANGTFTLTGTINGATFTLTVTLPSGTAPGNAALTTDGSTYTGTLTTTPTGSSTLAGSYLLTSLTNPATQQTVNCPGSLAFGSADNDACGASEIFTLNPNGTYTISINGTTASTGTYTLVGNIFTETGKELEANGNGSIVTSVNAVTVNGNTLTSTLLSTTATDAQPQIGEIMSLTKTGGTTANPFAGTYQGVASNNSGFSVPAVGTTTLTVSPTGNATATSIDASSGQVDTFIGTISGTGAFQLTQQGSVASGGGSVLSGTLSQNPTTHVFTAATTSVGTDTTNGTVTVGLAPTNSPLAGTYTGTDTTSGGYQGNDSFTIGTNGAVTGTVTLTGSHSGTVNFAGYVDASGNLYLDYVSGGTYATLIGTPTINGTTLSVTLQEYDSDQGGQAGPTVTLSLTKH